MTITATTDDHATGLTTVHLDGVEVVRNGHLALRVDRLDVGPGLTAVVGPNGSGKSTLLDVIAGLLRPRRGTVEVLGTTPAAARPRVAYVLQAQQCAEHLPVTAREVVALGRAPSVGPIRRLGRADMARIDEAMERLEVAHLARRHLARMSGGQRQRVLIAQGLAQDADVLMLDEPVAGLDIASIQTIRREIAVERDAGRTILVATHDLAEAANADCAVLLAGRVIASGNPAIALASDRLREAYQGRILDLGGHTVALDDGAHHHGHEHDHGPVRGHEH